jgi:hypothetical protein
MGYLISFAMQAAQVVPSQDWCGKCNHDVRLDNTVLIAGDRHLEHQFQVNPVVPKARPIEHNLGIHARRESIARSKDDVLTAHHLGLCEAVNRSEFEFGFVAQLQ